MAASNCAMAAQTVVLRYTEAESISAKYVMTSRRWHFGDATQFYDNTQHGTLLHSADQTS